MTEHKLKTFWERPEGTTGMIVGIAALVGVGWVTVTTILPFLVTLVWTGVELTVGAILLSILLYILSDKQIRTRGVAFYQVVMRWLTGLIVNLDPIAIMKGYVSSLERKMKTLAERIANVRGEMVSLKTKIDTNATAADKALHIAAGAAKDARTHDTFVLKSREAGRLQTSNRTLQQLYEKMVKVYQYLTHARKNTEFLIADLSSEIDVKSSERKAVRAAYSAISAARSVIDGDKNERALFDEALELQAADYGQKMGAIDEFMDVSSTFLDSLDLENGIYEEQALKQLEAWEQRSDPLLLADQHDTMPNLLTHGEPAYASLFTTPNSERKE